LALSGSARLVWLSRDGVSRCMVRVRVRVGSRAQREHTEIELGGNVSRSSRGTTGHDDDEREDEQVHVVLWLAKILSLKNCETGNNTSHCEGSASSTRHDNWATVIMLVWVLCPTFTPDRKY